MLEQSQNGQEPVTDAQLVTGNIVMWETRFSFVDRVEAKTQILRAILKTLISLGGESCIQGTSLKTKFKRSGNRDVDELSNVDHVVTSAKPSRFEAQLYIFEDN